MNFKSALVRTPFSRSTHINNSLVSSSAVLARVSKWAGNNKRERPCVLNFHHSWRHPDCPVMRWYTLQQISSTQFRSIQHRRDCEGPFFHEFLLLQLKDGSICRVERTGEGSTIDAVRNIGCRAHDYIQWFTASGYESFAQDQPSELISDVHFPQEFDIMDVLAICYTIREGPRTRSYTLQRYNCYFFCGTILLTLTRHLAPWQANLTHDSWVPILHQAIDGILHDSVNATERPLVLRVCDILEPSNRNAVGFILSVLRDRLGTVAVLESLKRAVDANLWWEARSDCLYDALAGHIDAAVAVALAGDGKCATALRSATSDSKHDLQAKIGTFAAIDKIVDQIGLRVVSRTTGPLLQAVAERYRMQEMENPLPFGRSLYISIISPVLGVFFPLELAFARVDHVERIWGFRDMMVGSLHGVVTAQRLGTYMTIQRLRARQGGIFSGLVASIEPASSFPRPVLLANYKIGAEALEDTLTELARQDMSTPPDVTVALHRILAKNGWGNWLNLSVRELLTSQIPDLLFEEERILVKFPDPNGGSVVSGIKTVAGFQEYMLQRIQAHANRVEEYRLAASTLVSEDIKSAIADVWKSLPPSFGSIRPVTR